MKYLIKEDIMEKLQKAERMAMHPRNKGYFAVMFGKQDCRVWIDEFIDAQTATEKERNCEVLRVATFCPNYGIIEMIQNDDNTTEYPTDERIEEAIFCLTSDPEYYEKLEKTTDDFIERIEF